MFDGRLDRWFLASFRWYFVSADKVANNSFAASEIRGASFGLARSQHSVQACFMRSYSRSTREAAACVTWQILERKESGKGVCDVAERG